MVFHIISLGLGDERDITVRGLEIVRKCERLYLEAYTAILGVDAERLSAFYGKEVTVADRTMVEQGSDSILKDADKVDIGFLVVGDAFAATTHHDLVLRAESKGIKVSVVHNASIMNAVACCGLQLYHFGQTISIPYFDGEWRPYSFYEKILVNYKAGLHTLCLLDIKVKEQSKENLAKAIEVYEPPRFMSVRESIIQLLECEENLKQGICTENAWAIGLARVGQENQRVVSGTLKELLDVDFGAPLHSLVLVGPTIHPLETEMFFLYHWDQANRETLKKNHIDAMENKRMAELEERAQQDRIRAAERRKALEEKRRRRKAGLPSSSESESESESD